MTPVARAPSEDVLTRPAPLPDAVVRYAAHEDGVVDVYLPPGEGPHPLVVVVHGGFWKQEYDRRHSRPMASALRDAGWVVAVPEYRRVGGRGGWPATARDVAAAVDALPSLLGGLGVRTGGLSLVGHSAGGHLVLWLASERVPADRVVALAPVGDLEAAARDGLGGGATQALLGGSPEQVPHTYAAADPMARLVDADPSTEILVLHGASDSVVPVQHSRGLAERHPQVDLRVLDAEHFELIDPRAPVWPDVLAAVSGRGETLGP